MTKREWKKAIKNTMSRYNHSLEQACWMLKKLNPEYTIDLNEIELEMTVEELLAN